MDRHTCKTLMVWLAVTAGAIGGCRCAPKTHPEAGMGMDTGIGNPCSDTMPCAAGLYCVGGMCAQDCSDTMPCADGATCTADGRCVGGACIETPVLTGCGQICNATTPCPSGLYCGDDGLCTADCSATVTCSNGQSCSSDGHCVGGGADAGVCSGGGAPTGCGSPCGPTTLCLAGLYCNMGSCTADCTSSIQCANGGTCSSDGHCIGGGSDAGICSGPSAPGGCGNVCTPTLACPSGLYCSNGFCTADCTGAVACANGLSCSSDGHCTGTGPECTVLQIECGGRCVERLSDPANCGTCGHTCPGTQVCNAGTCTNMCATRFTNCSRACVNTDTDAANCGGCGHVCPNNELCYSGVCGCATTRGETECNDECVLLGSDRENCGACNNVCNTTCPSHPNTCANQGIQCGAASDGCGGMLDCGDCSTGFNPGDTCGGGGLGGQCGQGVSTCHHLTCADLNVSCGPIGDGCGGIVQCGSCTLPDTCGGGGVLGQCGRPVCYQGSLSDPPMCEDMCPDGTTNCNHVCYHTDRDATNCGGCGIRCGLGTCNGGSCSCYPAAIDAGPGSDAGIQYCPPQGCLNCGPTVGCVNQMSDTHHCGDCNTACPSGSFCLNGACT